MKQLIALVLFIFTSWQGFSQKKNVVFIAIDDLKPLTGAYGDDYAITPNMDKLASMGFLFENAYTQQAVCAPSRASMLTGWRPDKTKVRDLKTLIRDKNPNVVTMPQYFKSKGYTTYATGKIFDPRSVDKNYDPVSWSVPYIQPHHLPGPGPEPIYGFYLSKEHIAEYNEWVKKGEAKGLKGGALNKYLRKNFKPSTEKADVSDDAYLDGRILNDALKKLDEFVKEDKPFMLMVGFKRPHLPFAAPAKYWDMYDKTKIPLAKWQKHSINGPAVAYHNNGELRSYTDIPESIDPKTGLVAKEKQIELIHGYYAATSYIDALIGRLMNSMEEKGLMKNTIIVLWGDHGWHLGDHGLWCKHTNFEQATRLPLIIYAPGKKPGKSTIPVETLDIFPTLCELTGIEPEPTLQGISLVPMLDGKKPAKEYAISQWPTKGGKGGIGYTIRTERYRYTEWYKEYQSTMPRDPSKLVATELYDYKEDPLETRNLVDDKNYKTVLKEHEVMLHDFLDKQVGTAAN